MIDVPTVAGAAGPRRPQILRRTRVFLRRVCSSDTLSRKHVVFRIVVILLCVLLYTVFTSSRDLFLTQEAHTPTADAPFVFYHIEKTGGSSTKSGIFNASKAAKLPSYFSCLDKVSCRCNLKTTAQAKQANTSVCDVEKMRESSVISGHFMPRVLWESVPNVQRGRCAVTLRTPTSRFLSHYEFFNMSRSHGGRLATELDSQELPRAIQAAGGPNYMTGFLSCGSTNCPESAGDRFRAAKEILDTCVVGVTEHYEVSVTLLSIVMPFLVNMPDNIIHEKFTGAALKSVGVTRFEQNNLHRFQEDNHLYQYAVTKNEQQIARLFRCHDVHYKGDGSMQAVPKRDRDGVLSVSMEQSSLLSHLQWMRLTVLSDSSLRTSVSKCFWVLP